MRKWGRGPWTLAGLGSAALGLWLACRRFDSVATAVGRLGGASLALVACVEETDLFPYEETDRFPIGIHSLTSRKGQT